MVIRLYKHGQAWNLNILQSKCSEEKKLYRNYLVTKAYYML